MTATLAFNELRNIHWAYQYISLLGIFPKGKYFYLTQTWQLIFLKNHRWGQYELVKPLRGFKGRLNPTLQKTMVFHERNKHFEAKKYIELDNIN